MTKFEQAAINRQYMAYRKDWAIQQFEQSCHICCITGRRASCDKCNIAYVHRLVIAALEEKEQKNKKNKEEQKMEKIKVYTTCRFCGKEYELEITQAQLDEFLSPNGRHIQDIFPELSPGMRELLISGMCPKCWNDLFSEPEF